MFKKVNEKLLHTDTWQAIYLDTIEFTDGSLGTYVRIIRMNGVGIVVTTTDNKILLQKEYRYVIDTQNWEIPGGGIDEGETPLEAAKRELFEETEIKAEKLTALGEIYPLHSLNTEKVSLFHAVVEADIQFSNTDNTDVAEHFSDRKFFTFEEALSMIDTGVIIDSVTAHAVQLVIRKLRP